MFKPALVLLSAAALLVVGYLAYRALEVPSPSVNTASSTSTPPPSAATASATPRASRTVSLRASFLIFTNGLKRDFSNSRYYNLSKDVYLQEDNPSIVYVKKASITWGDFFNTLPMKLSKDCLTTGTSQVFCSGSDGALSFYVRGVKASNALDLEIFDGDRLLVTYGNLNDEQIKQQLDQVSDPYILQKR